MCILSFKNWKNTHFPQKVFKLRKLNLSFWQNERRQNPDISHLNQTQFRYSFSNDICNKFSWNFSFINAESSNWFPDWRVFWDLVHLVGNLCTSANILNIKVSKDFDKNFVRERQTFKYGVQGRCNKRNCGWVNRTCTQYFIWLCIKKYYQKMAKNCSNFLWHIIWVYYRVYHIELVQTKWLWGVEGSIILLNYGV